MPEYMCLSLSVSVLYMCMCTFMCEFYEFATQSHSMSLVFRMDEYIKSANGTESYGRVYRKCHFRKSLSSSCKLSPVVQEACVCIYSLAGATGCGDFVVGIQIYMHRFRVAFFIKSG